MIFQYRKYSVLLYSVIESLLYITSLLHIKTRERAHYYKQRRFIYKQNYLWPIGIERVALYVNNVYCCQPLCTRPLDARCRIYPKILGEITIKLYSKNE